MFVMLVFAFFAIAGVAIDIGLANLTQQEMQVATDVSAIEGARLRNADNQIDTSDHHRRDKVSRMVRLEFDDDLWPTGNAFAPDDPQAPPADFDSDGDQMHMGAGPGMQVPGELGNQHVATSNETSVWDDPVLRVNVHNKQYGDMVSGTYRAGPTVLHTEVDDMYMRPDFEAGVSGTTGADASQYEALGFLVRMRRTAGTNPSDTEAGVSYHARPVPFLFSLGSLIQGDGGGGVDPRVSGIPVRATSIAVARPALRASAPPTLPDGTPIMDEAAVAGFEHPMIGLFPFALSLDYWVGRVVPSPTGTSDPLATWHQYQKLRIEPDGTLAVLADDYSPVLDTNGQPLVAGHFAPYGTSVGQEVQAAPPSSLDQQPWGYVALYTSIPGDAGPVSRVVGYGFCTLDPDPQADVKQLKSGIEQWGTGGYMAQVKCWIGPNGVSARLDGHAPNLTAAEWAAVFERNHFLVYGPWTDTQGNTVGGEVTYDYSMIRHGSVLAATLAR